MQSLAPWRRNCGIELTFVPKKYPKPKPDITHGVVYTDDGHQLVVHKEEREAGYYRHIKWEKHVRQLDKLLQKTGQLSTETCPLCEDYCSAVELPLGDVIGVWEDTGCVEAPTRILTDWKDAKEVWERVNAAADHVGLIPYEEHQETGMGHVHTTVTVKEAWNIEVDLLNRPYLPWLFVSPNQNFSCQSFGSGWEVEKLSAQPPVKPNANGGVNVGKDNVVRLCRDSRYDANGNYVFGTPHLEWRAFDAAEDWDEQEAHLAFLQNYYQHCERHPAVHPGKKGVRTYARQMRDRYAGDKGRCIREFKHLITKDLKLPWNSYEPYIGNLEANFQWGKRL